MLPLIDNLEPLSSVRMTVNNNFDELYNLVQTLSAVIPTLFTNNDPPN